MQVNYVSRASRLHVRQDVFGTEKGSSQVRLDNPVPEVFVHVGDTLPLREPPGEVRHDARIIHQDINAPVVRGHSVHHGLDLLLIPHVRIHHQRFDTHLA